MKPEDFIPVPALYGPPPFWEKAPVSAISRFRINTDGKGVNTLVTFYGCPLQCEYCLNRHLGEVPKDIEWMSTKELYDKVKKDSLYFRATGGGITFGGGEPLLRADFIREFAEKYAKNWKIRIETSLNAEQNNLYDLLQVVDEWIIDVKTLNMRTYENYTHGDFQPMYENLKFLATAERQKQCVIRIPLIFGYNDEKDREHTMKMLKLLGFSQFDLFKYIVPGE